ncbi:MAG: exodeoxyribonuclease V subunit beta [Pseudomonadota bacterium]
MGVMDLTTTPLTGLNLVEASAGTGKTYTLTGLYLRLLIEQSLSPEQILVVTYTNAATAELKERIRNRLVSAREAFECGESNDPLMQTLLQSEPDPQRVVKQLNLAIAGFDQAAIHTIHGFCQRVLIEHAFETSQPFDAELAPDQELRLQQIADDFWRTRLANLPDALTEHFLAQTGSPERLLAEVRQGVGKPYLDVRGAQWPEGIESIEDDIRELIQTMRLLWREEGAEVSRYLTEDGLFNQNTYKRQKVPGWCREMESWLAEEPPVLEGFGNLKKFTESSVKSGLRKGKVGQEFILFYKCQEVTKLIESRIENIRQAIRSLRLEFFNYLTEELPQRQQAAGEWSYDDLLLHLDQALSAQQGDRLALSLSQRFPAALVDEFQDTDPVQYRILSRIYPGSGCTVFMVGDPKQAIYSFRGADIFAYLTARDAAQGHYTLETNWRSTPQLIRAINTLFGANPAAFFYQQIPYTPIHAAPPKAKGLIEKGDKQGAFRIWQLPFDAKANLPAVRQAVADGTANEILRLLNLARTGRLSINSRPLGGGDIAVLVRTHQQAELIAASLMDRGVLSVRTAQDDVYLTAQAEQLERLMLALIEPRREALLRAALSTELLGWSGAEIDQLSRDDDALNDQLERFIAYHQTWRDAGFIRMFRQVLNELDVERRLLSYRDGERRLTNLYQLSELLHRHDSSTQPGMDGLLKWFSRQRLDEASKDEERLLRLESDSDLVKLVTQHGSKGLQYPVVFCPFLWDGSPGSGRSRTAYLFHDPQASYQAVFELGSQDFEQNQRYLREEELAENIRLLYVALTRAQYRCYMPWGKTKKSEGSALAWLLHPPCMDAEGRATHGAVAEDVQERPPSVGANHSLENCQAAFKKLTPTAFEQRLEGLAAASGGHVSVIPLPSGEVSTQLNLELPPDLGPARTFKGLMKPARWVSSFSSLTSGEGSDLPDHDAASTPWDDDRQEPQFNIHGFPRGARPGTCLHAIFEELDFTLGSPPEVERLVESTLDAYGIEQRWQPVIVDMLRSVVSTPLNAEGLVLKNITGHQRINEMEFYYPIQKLEPKLLESLARKHGFARSPEIMREFSELEFGRVQGFMKGFIDLIIEVDGRFYLLDYKSNWLGEDRSCYAQANLREAMLAHHYPLQYLFYVLALHRYLRQRLPDYAYDTHFGGVFYLFLRGMSPQTGPEYGVFQERPPGAFIQALDQWLSEGEP